MLTKFKKTAQKKEARVDHTDQRKHKDQQISTKFIQVLSIDPDFLHRGMLSVNVATFTHAL